MILDDENDEQHRDRLRRLAAAVREAYEADSPLEALKPAAAEAALDRLETRYPGLAELVTASLAAAEALAEQQVLKQAGAPKYVLNLATDDYQKAAERRTAAWDRVTMAGPGSVKMEGGEVRKLLETYSALADIAGAS